MIFESETALNMDSGVPCTSYCCNLNKNIFKHKYLLTYLLDFEIQKSLLGLPFWYFIIRITSTYSQLAIEEVIKTLVGILISIQGT